MPLENFLAVIQKRSRYLTCSRNIALFIEEKIKTIRHVDQKILAQKLENHIFFGFEVSEYSDQTLQKVLFFNENLIFHASRKFLEVIQPRSRYLTCSPNIALFTGEKIKTIRHVDQKIFKKNKIFVHKKKPSRAALQAPSRFYERKLALLSFPPD